LKNAIFVLFAFLLLWRPAATSANKTCGVEMAFACAGSCMRFAAEPANFDSDSFLPLAPVQSRPAVSPTDPNTARHR
jgi:hypothetical protein